ncbi:TPA: MoxR family ATPase [Candidatus Poribacteria bacterium]|nr:MoxR family ATPase [Candidatus Poribacteria bacterium]
MRTRDKASIERLLEEISKVIVGQEYLIERLIIGLLCAGHILIEGVPGLAKTTAVKTLASAIEADFSRIQFTPDLLPADLIGTMIYNPADGTFYPHKGPIFSNLLLADEINRAPAKVQSALLEAMQERQVTIGDTTFRLQEPFMVLATQNPIEQEGTYPLPEAQVDRFMLKLKLDYPSREEELQIMRRIGKGEEPLVEPVIGTSDILRMRDEVRNVYIDSRLEEYIVDVVRATRNPSQFDLADLEPLIEYGASPRASIYLLMTSRAHAFLHGRDFVLPEDIRSMAMDVLRHRIILSYEAEAEEITPEQIVTRILETIKLP